MDAKGDRVGSVTPLELILAEILPWFLSIPARYWTRPHMPLRVGLPRGKCGNTSARQLSTFRGSLQPTYYVVLLHDISLHGLEWRFVGIWGVYGALLEIFLLTLTTWIYSHLHNLTLRVHLGSFFNCVWFQHCGPVCFTPSTKQGL